MRNFQKTIIDLELIRDEQNLISFHREPDCSNFNESDGILIRTMSQISNDGSSQLPSEINQKYNLNTTLVSLKTDFAESES